MQYSVACSFRGKSEFSLFTFIHSNASLHSLSRQCHRCHNFLYFGQHIEIFGKKYSFAFHFVERDKGTCPSNDADPSDTDS